jgi:4-hydroxythreonine-4-phosphate dehydrogenase
MLEREARRLGLGLAVAQAPAHLSTITPSPQQAIVVEAGAAGAERILYGKVDPRAGRAALDFINAAARLCLDGTAAGMATAPVNKEALSAAGSAEVDHQTILKRLSGAPTVATCLVAGPLRAVHLSTHYPLGEAVKLVKRDRILTYLRATQAQLQRWGVPAPRIAVAALNPHGGEGGLIGREEVEEIAPAVQDACAEGIDARGPFPVDSLFPQARDGRWDAVLVHYHDQGHIPIKMHDFAGSVSVNIGLPFTRTSVDHGTAFDIAGKGLADETGMVEAILLAARLASGKGFSG